MRLNYRIVGATQFFELTEQPPIDDRVIAIWQFINTLAIENSSAFGQRRCQAIVDGKISAGNIVGPLAA